MFRALALVLSVAALTAPSGLAAHGAQGMRSRGVTSGASRASLCDRLDAQLGPKNVPFRSWSGC
jgi:hypothetical protein